MTFVIALLAAPAVGCVVMLVMFRNDLRKRHLLPSVDVTHPLWMDRNGHVWTAPRGGKCACDCVPNATWRDVLRGAWRRVL